MGSELYRFYVVLLYIPQVTPYIFCDIPHADQQLHVSLHLLVVLLVWLSELEVHHYDFFRSSPFSCQMMSHLLNSCHVPEYQSLT